MLTTAGASSGNHSAGASGGQIRGAGGDGSHLDGAGSAADSNAADSSGAAASTADSSMVEGGSAGDGTSAVLPLPAGGTASTNPADAECDLNGGCVSKCTDQTVTCSVQRLDSACELQGFVGASTQVPCGQRSVIGTACCGGCGCVPVEVFFDGTSCWEGIPQCTAFGFTGKFYYPHPPGGGLGSAYTPPDNVPGSFFLGAGGFGTPPTAGGSAGSDGSAGYSSGGTGGTSNEGGAVGAGAAGLEAVAGGGTAGNADNGGTAGSAGTTGGAGSAGISGASAGGGGAGSAGTTGGGAGSAGTTGGGAGTSSGGTGGADSAL